MHGYTALEVTKIVLSQYPQFSPRECFKRIAYENLLMSKEHIEAFLRQYAIIGWYKYSEWLIRQMSSDPKPSTVNDAEYVDVTQKIHF